MEGETLDTGHLFDDVNADEIGGGHLFDEFDDDVSWGHDRSEVFGCGWPGS